MKNLPLMYLEAKPPKLWRHGQLIVCRGKRVAGDILDLVKDDTGGLRDAEQAHEEGDDRKGTADQPIVGLESRDIVVLDTFGCEAVGLRHRLGVGLTSRGFGGTVGHGGWL
jgi:hypothetical protein